MNRRIVNEFLMEYMASDATGRTYWMGTPALKCPLDLWIYQEILFETRPNLIVECGTAYGGSALFLASMLDLLGDGGVFSIDIGLRVDLPKHPRITYCQGSSVAPPIVAEVASLAGQAARTMVVLDSDHSAAYVSQELDHYAAFVTPSCYLIVEDTIIGHPYLAEPKYWPGPAEALAEWLPKHPEFAVDRDREKFGLTWHPGGYLRRLS